MRKMIDVFINDQRVKLADGRIDRRQFVKSMVAAGIVLPTAISMSDSVLAMTPKKGGCRMSYTPIRTI